MRTLVGVLVLGGLAYLFLMGRAHGDEKILAEGSGLPEKVARALEITVNNVEAGIEKMTPRIEMSTIHGEHHDHGGPSPTSLNPFDYLKEKYPLVKEWEPSGAPVVKYYSGQDPQEKAQIKAAWKEYDKLKRARKEGYDNIGEWMAAREAREEAMRAEARAGIAAAETAKRAQMTQRERAQMTQRERIEMKQELGEPLTLQERLATLPGGMTPEEALKGGQMSVGGGQVVQSPAAAMTGFIKAAFKIT